MSNIHTPTDHVLVKVAQHAATATGNGTSIDTLGYTRALVLVVGTTASSSTLAAQVQDSPDNSTFTNVTNATASIAASQTNADYCINVNLDKRNRYLRVPLTITGTTTGDVVVVLFNGRYKAPTQDNSPVSV